MTGREFGTPAPGRWRRSRTFRSEWASVPLARDFVRSSLLHSPAVSGELVDDVELAVSELATNGIRHGSGDPVEVELLRNDSVLTIRVSSTLQPDTDGDPSTWEVHAPMGPVGRGIGIVRALSAELTFHVDGRAVSASCSFPIVPIPAV